MKDKNKKAREILASDLSAIVNHKQIKSKLSNHKTLSERQFTPVFYNKYIFSGFQKKCYKAWWKAKKERKKMVWSDKISIKTELINCEAMRIIKLGVKITMINMLRMLVEK